MPVPSYRRLVAEAASASENKRIRHVRVWLRYLAVAQRVGSPVFDRDDRMLRNEHRLEAQRFAFARHGRRVGSVLVREGQNAYFHNASLC